MTKAYTVTIAQSRRGNYHISQLKYAALAVDDTVQQLTPVCNAKAEQVASFVSYGIGEDFPSTYEVYTENVYREASCDGCHYGALSVHWPRNSHDR